MIPCRHRRTWSHLALATCLLGAPMAASAVPQGFNVQGRLSDAQGVNKDGSFSIKFTIFDAATAGTKVWSKTFQGANAVTVRNGNFQVILGPPSDGGETLADALAGDNRYLEIQVVGPTSEDPMAPRQRLVSVPFALRAAVADATSVVSAVPTRQALTSGMSATYSTPAGARQLRIRMVGGGGGGAGTHSGAGPGGNGGDTSFYSIVAKGGGGGSNSVPGGGGAGGSGAASFRVQGASAPWNIGSSGGDGASGPWGGGGAGVYLGENPRNPGAPNSGSGGGSSWCNGCSPATGHGGGAGEYVEIIISNPAASYIYTVGAGGARGPAASYPGAPGGSGVIVVDELY